jgi:hypothetical protein
MGKGTIKNLHGQEKTLFSEVLGFSELEKPLQINFTAPDLSSNGGLLLVSRAEKEVRIASELARVIPDWRNQKLIHHTMNELIQQRIYQAAAGYEDADDCDLLRDDQILKMCCGRQSDASALCSQPTMSRLENHVSSRVLYNMGVAFVKNFINSYDKEPDKIILDLDDSNANTYGGQQLTLFNQYYGEYCYLPLFIFEGYSGRMILPLLRPGRTDKRTNVARLLKRLIIMIRRYWKKTIITVRGDAMFCSHEFFDWAKTQNGIHYCVGISGNQVLLKRNTVLRLQTKAESLYIADKKPVQVFGRLYYKAANWKSGQWIFVKVECNNIGFNIRFIVSSNGCLDPEDTYKRCYCKRGDCELYIKELKNGLNADRMSCGSFLANQFRLFMYAAAYVLLWHVRKVMFAGTEAESWSIITLRCRIILSAVVITTKKTFTRVEFARGHPYERLIKQGLFAA